MISKYPIVDSHVHLRCAEDIDDLANIADYLGIERMSIASVLYSDQINENPEVFEAKSRYPNRFYIFPGLDHSTHFSNGRIETPSLTQQLELMIDMGADGLKLIETKPSKRKQIDIPMDSGYYDDLFARLEGTGFPVIWHVGDPGEFWDPKTTPSWAADGGMTRVIFRLRTCTVK